MVTQVLGLTNASARDALQHNVIEERNFSHLEIFNNTVLFKNSFIGSILNRLTYCSECEAIKRENEKIRGIIRSMSTFSESTNLPSHIASAVLPYLSDKQIGLLNFDQIRGIKEKLSNDEFIIFLQRGALDKESKIIWKILAAVHRYSVFSLKNLLEQAWFNNYLIKNPKVFEVLLQSISDEMLNNSQVKPLLIDLLKDCLSHNYVYESREQDPHCFSALKKIKAGISFDEAVIDVVMLQEPKDKKKNDVIIVVGNKRILSDREMLVGKSAFFKESLQDQNEIKLEEITPNLFRRLNHYILADQIEIDKSNYLELLDANKLLGIDGLAKEVEEFLISKPDMVLVDTLLYYSKKYNLLKLKDACEERLIQSQRAVRLEVLSQSFRHELEIAARHKLDDYIKECLFAYVKTPFNAWLKSTPRHFDEIVKYCEIAEYFTEDQFDFFKSSFFYNLENIVIKDHFLVSLWREADKGKKGSEMLKIICGEFVKRNPMITIQLFDNLVPDDLQAPLNQGLFPLM